MVYQSAARSRQKPIFSVSGRVATKNCSRLNGEPKAIFATYSSFSNASQTNLPLISGPSNYFQLHASNTE